MLGYKQKHQYFVIKDCSQSYSLQLKGSQTDNLNDLTPILVPLKMQWADYNESWVYYTLLFHQLRAF